MDEMLIKSNSSRRRGAASSSIVSADLPYWPGAAKGSGSVLRASLRLMKEAGADMIKVDAAAEFPEVVRRLVREGILVFAQFWLTPQTASEIR